MRLKVFKAAAFALGLGMTVHPQAAMSADGEAMKRLVQSAYFSGVCRQATDALGIAPASEASALLAAFAAIRGQRAIEFDVEWPDVQHDDCAAPVVLLISLLRRNGLDAELVFASMAPNGAAADGVPADKIDRVLVYVPVVDRYVDPAAPAGKQAVVDQIIRESAQRMHLRGPSLANDAGGACADTCLHVYTPGASSSARVRTEVVRGR
jgi:hypothetical protein